MIFRVRAQEIGASVYVLVESAPAVGQPFRKRGTLRMPASEAESLRACLLTSARADLRPDGSIVVAAPRFDRDTVAITCPLCDWSARNDADADTVAQIEHYLRIAFVEHVARAHVAPDCVCRTPRCGHRASRHVGERGACVEPGCACGPGGWS